ncbi:hypothetical protein AgCh_013815 [Apium graveolens]
MTGVVVDVGDGAIHVVPVADGYVIGSSIRSIPLSGKYVNLFIQQLMWERGEHIPPEDSLEVARNVKESYCYICSDIVKVTFWPEVGSSGPDGMLKTFLEKRGPGARGSGPEVLKSFDLFRA